MSVKMQSTREYVEPSLVPRFSPRANCKRRKAGRGLGTRLWELNNSLPEHCTGTENMTKYVHYAYSASNFIRDSVTVSDFYSRILHGSSKTHCLSALCKMQVEVCWLCQNGHSTILVHCWVDVSPPPCQWPKHPSEEPRVVACCSCMYKQSIPWTLCMFITGKVQALNVTVTFYSQRGCYSSVQLVMMDYDNSQ